MRWLPIWGLDSTRCNISVCPSLSLSTPLLQRRLVRHLVRTLCPNQHRHLLLQPSPWAQIKNLPLLATFLITRWRSPLSSRGALVRNHLSVRTLLFPPKTSLCLQSGWSVRVSEPYPLFHRKGSSCARHGNPLFVYVVNSGWGEWRPQSILHGATSSWYSEYYHISYHVYEGLYCIWDNESGRLSHFFSICEFSRFSFNLLFHNDLCCPQVIPGVCNLMQQQTHLFQWLEAAETTSAYIAHNMNGNEELLTDLETTRSEVTTAQKLTK